MLPSPLRESLPEHAVVSGGGHVGAWPTLLVVDGDAEMRLTLVCYFEKRGFHVAAGGTLAEAKTFLQQRKAWSLVLSDYHLPDGTAMELMCWARDQAGSTTPFLLMSGSLNIAALCQGVDYLAKPFRASDLEARVRALLGRMGQ